MTDEVDIANDRAELERSLAIANITRGLYQGPSATECEECDEAIPEARRLAVPGVRLCVGCAEMAEHRQAGFVSPIQYEEEEV